MACAAPAVIRLKCFHVRVMYTDCYTRRYFLRLETSFAETMCTAVHTLYYNVRTQMQVGKLYIIYYLGFSKQGMEEKHT